MDLIKYYLRHICNATVRKNDNCPDGYEHQMPDGSYMCGREHEEAYNLSQEETQAQICKPGITIISNISN